MAYTKDKSTYLVVGYTTVSGTQGNLTNRVRITRKLSKSSTGDRNPGWRMKIKKVQNATTGFSAQYSNLTYRPARVAVTFKYNGAVVTTSFSGNYPAYSVVAPSALASYSQVAYDRALQQFLKSVRAAQVEFSAPTFLGELRESLHMIRHPGEALRDSAKDWLNRLVRRKKQRPKNWQKGLAGMWLEHSFGWAPLMNDLHSAYQAYARRCNETRVIACNGFGNHAKDVSPATPTLSGWLQCKWSELITLQELYLCKFRGVVLSETKATLWQQSELFGFRIEEFVPTAWELLPWSFLVDYFTNIGDILENSVTNTSNLRWNSVSQVADSKRRWIMIPDHPRMAANTSGYISSEGYAGHAEYTVRKVSRGTWSGGLPSLKLELPGTVGQFCNMAALFAQANAVHPQSPRKAFRS